MKHTSIPFESRFLPLRDFIFAIIPAVASCGVFFKEHIPESYLPSDIEAVAFGTLFSIILAIWLYQGNVKEHKKSLVEILATGYFLNFTGRLANLLKGKDEIVFEFPHDIRISLPPEKVNVEVGMPQSFKSLDAYSEKVKTQSEIVYIRDASLKEPYWIRAKREANGTLTIYEFPRTLFAIPKYLKNDFSNAKRAEATSKKLYKEFDTKTKQLICENTKEMPSERFNIINV